MKKRNRQLMATMVAIWMLLSSVLTPAGAEAAGKKLKVTCAKTVKVGSSIKIKTNIKATFQSSDKKIATVNAKGVVKGKKAGKVKITVTSKSNKKQKKIVKITVKKKTETKVPGSEATQTPAPSTLPSTLPGTTQNPSPSVSPNVSPSPFPSVSPSAKPVGITAEYKGKVPVNYAFSNIDATVYSTWKYGAIVKVQYSDGTELQLESKDFSQKYDNELYEEDGKLYAKTVIAYDDLEATLYVEIVEVDADTVYPDIIMTDYTGGTIKKGEMPNLEDVSAQFAFINGEVEDANGFYIGELRDESDYSRYRCILVYDYYFEYNGEMLYRCVKGDIYVPYE